MENNILLFYIYSFFSAWKFSPYIYYIGVVSEWLWSWVLQIFDPRWLNNPVNSPQKSIRPKKKIQCSFGLLLSSFYQPSSSEVFSTGYVSVDPLSFIIGSLTSCDVLLDIIVDPWWVIDGDVFLRDVSPTRFNDSVLEELKSLCSITIDNETFKSLIIKIRTIASKFAILKL